MRELLDIVAASAALSAAGKSAALATVIGVDGSSYRRPGAKMLIAENGQTWGGISGGCLERDVVRNAIGVLGTNRPIVVRYDTADDEQLAPATSTGCGGTIEVFIQPIGGDHNALLQAMTAAVRDRQTCQTATIVRSNNAALVGATWSPIKDNGDAVSARSDVACAVGDRPPAPVIANGRATCITTDAGDDPIVWFVQTFRPPQSLIIFGAGPDVVPIVSIAQTLGWQTTVVATPPAIHVNERFAAVDRLRVTSPDDPAGGVSITRDAAVLIMTHSVVRDARILAALADRSEQPAYLGLLGPRHRTEKLLDQVPRLNEANLFSPLGLDLGAETPEEIALAVMAEIQAALRNASAEPLRQKLGPIHAFAPAAIPTAPAVSCAV